MLSSKTLCRLSQANRGKSAINISQKASICHKDDLEPPKNTYHWPYERRSFGYLNFFLDPFTKSKFNENTKIIQIEGNIKAGKTQFAAKLADKLGMKLMEPIDLDSYYINDHGYDYRALNPLMPERLRLCDWEMFHENPSRHSAVHLSYYVFKLRLEQYIKALQHIFNTGQGVVLVRSVFTDRVFNEAKHEIGWSPKGYLRGDGVRFYDLKHRYNFVRNMALFELPKPHLTIYLNTPVDVCMERIKNDSDPIIANSKALVPEFLQEIENAYRDHILPKVDFYGHSLEYETPKLFSDDEVMDVVDDIRELDFTYDYHDTKFENWEPNMYFWHFTRRRWFTSRRVYIHFGNAIQPWYDIAGLGDSITNADLILRRALFEGHLDNLGLRRKKRNDPQVSNLLQVIFGHTDYGVRMREAVRTDFV